MWLPAFGKWTTAPRRSSWKACTANCGAERLPPKRCVRQSWSSPVPVAPFASLTIGLHFNSSQSRCSDVADQSPSGSYRAATARERCLRKLTALHPPKIRQSCHRRDIARIDLYLAPRLSKTIFHPADGASHRHPCRARVFVERTVGYRPGSRLASTARPLPAAIARLCPQHAIFLVLPILFVFGPAARWRLRDRSARASLRQNCPAGKRNPHQHPLGRRSADSPSHGNRYP